MFQGHTGDEKDVKFRTPSVKNSQFVAHKNIIMP